MLSETLSIQAIHLSDRSNCMLPVCQSLASDCAQGSGGHPAEACSAAPPAQQVFPSGCRGFCATMAQTCSKERRPTRGGGAMPGGGRAAGGGGGGTRGDSGGAGGAGGARHGVGGAGGGGGDATPQWQVP